MPNGDPYSLEEFQQLDDFIKPMDPAIEEFATSIGAEFIVGDRNAPDRRIVFHNADKLSALIDVAPRFINISGPSCFVDAIVHRDHKPTPEITSKTSLSENVVRKWWHKRIAELSQMPESLEEFVRLLNDAYTLIQSIGEDDLKIVK